MQNKSGLSQLCGCRLVGLPCGCGDHRGMGPSAQKLVQRIARFENMRSGTHVHELSLFIWRQLSFALVGQVGKQLHRASLPAATSTRVPGHTHSVSAAAPSLLLEGGAGVI